MIRLENYRAEVQDFMNCLYRELELRNKTEDSWDISLKILADNLENYYGASEIVAEEGLVITGGRGAMIHPAERIRQTLQIRIEKMVQEFGISPKSLKFVTTEVDDTEDMIEELVGI